MLSFWIVSAPTGNQSNHLVLFFFPLCAALLQFVFEFLSEAAAPFVSVFYRQLYLMEAVCRIQEGDRQTERQRGDREQTDRSKFTALPGKESCRKVNTSSADLKVKILTDIITELM